MPRLPAATPAIDAINALGAERDLEHVTLTIAERLRPRRIVLFGSRGRGTGSPDSDYDIMVEMETDLPAGEREDLVYDLFDDLEWNMDVVVYTPDEVQRWRDDVGMIMYDIVREGRVLYSRRHAGDDQSVTALVPPARVSEGGRRAPESLALWIHRAQRDFDAMRAAANWDPPPWDAVCFHAHQCVEKLLKAALISGSIRPPRTHSLPDLLEACERAGFDVSGLRRPCKRLQRLYPHSRYPTKKEPTRSDAASAFAAANALHDAILPLLTSIE